MPTQVTLDDLAVMAAADENHRYELSPEGAHVRDGTVARLHDLSRLAA
ncbi:hypothetical protein [Actinoplanes sp. ATCC 53533]|nr:hypothetical protein [Actinoplanes sp. ATCC 53533]